MILINGEREERIAASDRGLHYGDGLFETIAVVDGRLQRWRQHMERLNSGAARLGLPDPDPEQLQSECEQLITEAGEQRRAVVKILYTHGSGGRGYGLPDPAGPQRILMLKAWPYTEAQQRAAIENGVHLHLCQTRLGWQPQLAGIKHLNRLEQVLARREWNDHEIAEGAMMDHEHHLIEGVMSNLFFAREGVVITPDLSRCGVAGVVRQVLIEQLQQRDHPVQIRPVKLRELAEMDEAFCSNSLIGIWPIRQIGEHHFSAPGRVTRHCIERLNRGS